MSGKADGMNYAPSGKSEPVVGPGEFIFAVMHLDHGHINGQTQGLLEAGATLSKVYDPDTVKIESFCKMFPTATPVDDPAAILEDDTVKLVASAAIPNVRGKIGCRVMEHGKDYFTDKCPFTTLDQLDQARSTVEKTSQKYAVYFSERLHVECAVHAGILIEQGAIGRVIQVIGMGPHRLNASSRPDWFYNKEQYGGIICDIGSHQIEQFLHYSGNDEARIVHSAAGNFGNPDHPELEDFGEMNLVGANGAVGYHRVDWFNPDGLRSWGDGRTFILGTEGYIELRKYIDVGTPSDASDILNLVDSEGEHRMELSGQVGFPFFGQLIRDCLDRTEIAMTQAHTFKAAELSLIAQRDAVRLTD